MTVEKSGSQGGESSHHQTGRQTSKREFARLIGVSDTAVRKAIAAGRLTKSLGKTPEGDAFIADVDLARREWEASSRTSAGVRTKPPEGANLPPAGSHLTPAPSIAASAPRPQAEEHQLNADEPIEEAGGQLVFATTLIDAQTAATNERARKLKMENDVTEGRLVPIEVVTKEAFETRRIIRENILNLPARIAGELAAENDTGRVHRRLEAALHEALNATADALLAVNE